MGALILSLLGTTIASLGGLTYAHPKKMRKIHIAALIMSFCFGIFLLYIQSTITEDYDTAVLEIKLVDIKMGKGESDLLHIAESSVLSKQIMALSINQKRMIYSAYIIAMFAIFIGLTFLFQYLKDEKKVQENKSQDIAK